jgi:ABC-type microcin C transport system permease subunit YejB
MTYVVPAGTSMLIILVGSLLLGVAAASFRDTWFDWLVRGASYFNIAAPSFWVALLAILIFAVWLEWLPGAGASDPRALDSSTIDLRYLILPALTQEAVPTFKLALVEFFNNLTTKPQNTQVWMGLRVTHALKARSILLSTTSLCSTYSFSAARLCSICLRN